MWGAGCHPPLFAVLVASVLLPSPSRQRGKGGKGAGGGRVVMDYTFLQIFVIHTSVKALEIPKSKN